MKKDTITDFQMKTRRIDYNDEIDTLKSDIYWLSRDFVNNKETINELGGWDYLKALVSITKGVRKYTTRTSDDRNFYIEIWKKKYLHESIQKFSVYCKLLGYNVHIYVSIQGNIILHVERMNDVIRSEKRKNKED